MFQAIAYSLPIAFGIVLATLPLMAVPLTLVSRGAVRVLGWFLAGYLGGFVGLAGVVILSADLLAFASTEAARWTVWLRLLLGVALLGLAWYKWWGRPRQGEAAAPPAWVQALDRLGSPGAAGLGFVLVVLNPKNALLVASGGLAIAAATPAPAAQAVALIVFSAVSCLGVAAPLLLWLMLGEKVRAPLGRLRGLLVRYDAQILTVVLAGLGLVIILSAVTAAAAPSAIVSAFDDNCDMHRVAKLVPMHHQQAADLAYWLSRPMADRIAAVETLRAQTLSPADPLDAEPRLQRVCRVAQRASR